MTPEKLTYVLRWKGFEWALSPEKPYHEQKIELTLGEHIVDRVVGNSGAPKWIPLWAFDFKEVDSGGRRVYEATADPYESIVEAAEQEKLARYVLAHEEEIEEGAADARAAQED